MQTAMVPRPAVQELIECARKGDRDAFDELARQVTNRLRESIAKWSRFRLGACVEVDDVLQETLLRAYRSLGRFEPQTGADSDAEESFRRWISGVAKHALADLLRKAPRREHRGAAIKAVSSVPSPSRVQRREDRFDRFQHALDRLPPDYRRVVVLSRLEGLSAEEIAKRMGRTPNAVYHLIVRALRLLREEFGDTESFHLPDRPLRRDGDDHGK